MVPRSHGSLVSRRRPSFIFPAHGFEPFIEARSSRRRALRLGGQHPLCPDASSARGHRLHRLRLAGSGSLRRALLRADVLHHRRLPPLLRPPQLQDEPLVPVRAGVRRRHRGAEGPALVGGSPPPPPPHSDTEADVHSRGRASGGATSAGSSATSSPPRPTTPSRTSPSTPSSCGSTATTGPGHRARRGRVAT
jgi:hypothetical protein